MAAAGTSRGAARHRGHRATRGSGHDTADHAHVITNAIGDPITTAAIPHSHPDDDELLTSLYGISHRHFASLIARDKATAAHLPDIDLPGAGSDAAPSEPPVAKP